MSETTDGVLTQADLDACFAAIRRQPPRLAHDCRFDGHRLAFNPSGFARCVHCGASEADVARP
jgi:hypothetical protein